MFVLLTTYPCRSRRRKSSSEICLFNVNLNFFLYGTSTLCTYIKVHDPTRQSRYSTGTASTRSSRHGSRSVRYESKQAALFLLGPRWNHSLQSMIQFFSFAMLQPWFVGVLEYLSVIRCLQQCCWWLAQSRSTSRIEISLSIGQNSILVSGWVTSVRFMAVESQLIGVIFDYLGAFEVLLLINKVYEFLEQWVVVLCYFYK